jgi:hypothetical protein
MANSIFNPHGVWGSEDIEDLEKRREKTFHKDKEINDLIKEMHRIGVKRFREMFGLEIYNDIKELADRERKLFPLKEKIRLQSKLKHDLPMCEKCVNWDGLRLDSKPCPFDNENYEKNITFESNELFHESLPTEVCDKFVWKKDDK